MCLHRLFKNCDCPEVQQSLGVPVTKHRIPSKQRQEGEHGTFAKNLCIHLVCSSCVGKGIIPLAILSTCIFTLVAYVFQVSGHSC